MEQSHSQRVDSRQLFNNFLDFYETRKSFTVYTKSYSKPA